MKYAIRFEHDSLHFSASHFITFGKPEKVEALHGHNFRIKAEITGPLNERDYVVDFVIAFNSLKRICDELSHCVLLPKDHPCIRIKTAGGVIHAAIPPLQWSFPEADSKLLPVRNTTTEALAEYIACRYRLLLERDGAFEYPSNQYGITIELEESPGMWAICRS
ncbi:MAG: 6-carboxytetrahydropterin synthase [Planctomycetaceae bacterium]|jgi:6-pyruvoyltetrahydropterin/6-carboxytetrahydropterin synthase|nr:6-carboxytetrahydropterin synthase [Planctomycetaceae bacterium]